MDIDIKKKEIWVDNVKVIACVFVVLGHFFQSMVKAQILPGNDLFQWFNQTIYFFHVPLFFISSGFLYQKFTLVSNIKMWGKNIFKKGFILGIPYIVFSTLTWGLKFLFPTEINSKVTHGIVDTLLFHPISPYWYLYTLILIFIVTPTFINRYTAIIGLVLAILFKCLAIYGVFRDEYIISTLFTNEIWFVLGMCFCICGIRSTGKIWIFLCCFFCVAFFIASVIIYQMRIENEWIFFGMGVLACVGIIGFTIAMSSDRKQNKYFFFLSKYSMPIYLMHTLFTAPLRIILLKLGIANAFIHILVGIAISFLGSITVAKIMKKIKWVEFILYPGKFIKM